MRQQENIKLFRLIEENPTLRVLPLVDTECVPSDDYNWEKVIVVKIHP